jgi:hypothetical protein
MDFSTGGVTGVPVIAVDSCRIWRMRIWNGGYGKALYARLHDGTIAVYGHLSRFVPELEAVVEEEQDMAGAYEIEIYPDAGDFAFLPGETLGFSGDTGTGPPHLHFELRTGEPDHSKLNPVPDYLDLAESLQPVIESLRLVPLDAWSSIGGGYAPVTLSRSELGDVLHIEGSFGVSVSAIDRVQCGRVVHPVAYDAWIDETKIWSLNLNRFPFSKSNYVGGLYEIADGRKHVRLFDPYGLDFSGFTCGSHGGGIEPGSLNQGAHYLRVRVRDAWGNADSVAVGFLPAVVPRFKQLALKMDGTGVTVEVEPDPPGSYVELSRLGDAGVWQPVELSEPRSSSAVVSASGLPLEVRCLISDGAGPARVAHLALGGSSAATDTFDLSTVVHPGFIEIRATSTGPPASLPSAVVSRPGLEDTLLFQPAGENLFRTAWVPPARAYATADHEPWNLRITAEFNFGSRRVAKTEEVAVGALETGSEIWFDGERYAVCIRAPQTRISRSLVAVREVAGTAYEGFGPPRGGFVLEPAGYFSSDGLVIVVTAKEGDLATGHGVFAWSQERVSFLGRFDSAGRCELGVNQLENLLVLAENEPPEITRVSNLRIRSPEGKADFAARITDRASGVDLRTVRAYVDDEVAIVSIDPDTGTVAGRTTKPLPSGKHSLRLEAEDRLGNRASRDITVDLAR